MRKLLLVLAVALMLAFSASPALAQVTESCEGVGSSASATGGVVSVECGPGSASASASSGGSFGGFSGFPFSGFSLLF